MPRLLAERHHLSQDAVRCLASGVPLPGQGVITRLAVFCDGFDELRAEASAVASVAAREALRDFRGTLCGGAWATSAVKVVVTSRESRLVGRGEEEAVFGPDYARLVMLPFSLAKVCGVWGVGCGVWGV